MILEQFKRQYNETPWKNFASTAIKAAVAQISLVLYSPQGTVEKILKKIHEATKGVQFAIFPETIIPYYPYFSFVRTICKGKRIFAIVGKVNYYTICRYKCYRKGSQRSKYDCIYWC